jgi:hypothetical protein
MTAADIQAIADSVTAASAALALTGWTWLKLRRAWKWHASRRAKRVQGDALPMVATVAVVAGFLAWLLRGGDS